MENYFLFFKHAIIKAKAMNKLTDSKLFQFCKCVTDVLADVSEEQNKKSTLIIFLQVTGICSKKDFNPHAYTCMSTSV